MLKKIKDFFTPTEWDTVWTVKCKAILGNVFGSERVNATIVLRVSKNKIKPKHKCYITDGVHTTDIDVNVIIPDCPEVKTILDNLNIKY